MISDESCTMVLIYGASIPFLLRGKESDQEEEEEEGFERRRRDIVHVHGAH